MVVPGGSDDGATEDDDDDVDATAHDGVVVLVARW